MTADQIALAAAAVLYTGLSIAFVRRVDGPVRAAGLRRTWLRGLIRKRGAALTPLPSHTEEA